MASIDFQGWMPIDAVIENGRPGLSWMDLTGVEFSEPFFQQTIDRIRTENPDSVIRFTELDALIQLEKTFDSIAPSGFIFHSSRCGSTLLANILRVIPDTVVLSEPPAVDKLVARFITDVDREQTKAMLYSIFLRAVVKALGQRRTGRERHLFVKFSCCSVSQIERIRRIWPDVPWMFLYRNPIETIVSNMEGPPAWLQDEDHRVLASAIGASPAAVAQMSPEELCARSIASFYSSALRVANDRTLLLNYNQLTPDVFSDTLKFFGIRPSAAELDAIAARSQTYSKAVSQNRAFVADSEQKRHAASSVIREAAETWASKPYQLLEQKRLELSNHEFN
jgi:hypothetical protein